MATKKTQPSRPVDIEAIVHNDKRTNIPTADAQDFLDPEAETVGKLLYARDPSLDPQLVWKGKDDADRRELEVDVPPIYIQEKIDPRVLIENLRATATKPVDEPELTLFDSFDGLDELDIVDFYKHDANWSNRMILGDSLQVMASLAERESLRGKVQMVYLDPPYGIKFGSNWQARVGKPKVADGVRADRSFEAEQIKAFRDTWELGIHSYLAYLRDRLVCARDLLNESGSCFVQIGDENLHLVRSLMDEVFGSENFVVQIVTQKTSGAGSPSGSTSTLSSVADHVVWYAKNLNSVKYRELLLAKGFGSFVPTAYNRIELRDGSRRSASEAERSGSIQETERIYALDNLTSASGVDKTRYPVTLDGRTHVPGTAVWKTSEEGMKRLLWARRVEATSSRLGYVRYLSDFPAIRYTNVWTDTVSSFMSGKVYVVQTNTKVIERCMLMCSDPGDLVVDPTCGSGTTAYVGEQWGRRWITIDTSRVALALARQRLMGSRFPYYLLSDTPDGRQKEQKLASRPIPNSQPTYDIRHGFVYERIPHIKLGDIAKNPDIREGMSRDEIDIAIQKHAGFELLYDRPYEDKTKVRVSGPFTVESLSPHRSLAFSGAIPEETIRVQIEDVPPVPFEQTILDNLAKAGVQNGRKNERLLFESIEAYAGTHIQAIGIRSDAPEGAPKRVAIAVGPQYGTVSSKFIKECARQSFADPEIDLLCVLGFSFDPKSIDAADTYLASDKEFAAVAGQRQWGRIPTLLVRMNSDLLMGEELKKTGSGNLFTVFGEPDIEISRTSANEVVVKINGVDVYDPSTGVVRSSDTDLIALWMIDTNYNGESFFVRHCYFTGGNDPYARLKKSLKAEIDEDAWATLYSTTSRPFPAPETGKIAVKVINDYGDEVMQVFDVA